MSKSFIQVNDTLFGVQLRNFYNKSVIYGGLLGFTPEELESIKRDSTAWDYCMEVDFSFQKFARDYTRFKKLLRMGDKDEFIKEFPRVPGTSEPPAIVVANIQLRFRQAAAKAKSSPNYTKAIGTELGIEKTLSPFDPQLGKPVLKAKMNVGRPTLSYIKKEYKGLVIYKDTGDGYTVLGTAFKSKYEDPSPLPEPGKSAIWKYKAVYVWDGKETGYWSDEITVVVNG
ncbi:MAG: hypothetical protein WCJ62_03175 [Flavobacterium sp.]